MTSALVGSARVEITGDLSALAEQGKAQITAAVEGIAATAEKEGAVISAAFAQIGEEATTAFSDVVSTGGAAAGAEFSTSAAEGVRGSAPELVGATTTAATEAGEAAGARLAEMGAAAGEKFSEAAAETAKGLSGALLPMIGALGAGELVKSSVEAADQLEGANIKVENVFGESGKAVNQWALGVAGSLRMSAVSADQTAGRFGAFLGGLGVNGEEGAKLSETLTGLTANMAAFNNADPAAVESALDSALKGRTAALKQYGVTLQAGAPLQALMARGVDLSSDAMKDGQPVLTNQQKALGTLYAVMDATKNQQGALAKTSDTLKGRQQVLSAEFTNFRAELGAKLMPVLAKIAGYLITDVIPALAKVGEWIQKNQAWLKPLAATILALVAVWKIATAVAWAWNAAMDADPIVLIIMALVALGVGLYEAYQHSATFRDIVNDMGNALKVVWQDVLLPVVNFFENNWKPILIAAGLILLPFIAIPALIITQWGRITGFFSGLWGDITRTLSGAVSWLYGVGTQIVQGLVNGEFAMYGAILRFFYNIPGWIFGAISGAGSWLVSVGDDLIQGLIRGMGNIASRIGGIIKGGISAGINDVKHFFGIASPSKYMADQIGQWIPAGVAMGIDQGSSKVGDSMSSMLAGTSGNIVTASVMQTLATAPLSRTSLSSGAALAGTSSSGTSTVTGGQGMSMDDLVAAIAALAGRPVLVQVDGKTIARASANGQLQLDRRN